MTLITKLFLCQKVIWRKKQSRIKDLGLLGVGHTTIFNVQCQVGITGRVTELKKERWLCGSPRGKSTASAKTPQRKCLVLEEEEAGWHGREQKITHRHQRGIQVMQGLACRETLSKCHCKCIQIKKMLGLPTEKILSCDKKVNIALQIFI